MFLCIEDLADRSAQIWDLDYRKDCDILICKYPFLLLYDLSSDVGRKKLPNKINSVFSRVYACTKPRREVEDSIIYMTILSRRRIAEV